jgi:hypothetical protein
MNQGIETQQIEARAAGGPVNAGQPYLVGELGPEVIVPQNNGMVLPNRNPDPAIVGMQNGQPDYGYGNRWDESTKAYTGPPKGVGYYGELQRPDGNISGELGMGRQAGAHNEIPTMVPGLSPQEMSVMLSTPEGQRYPDSVRNSIRDKAESHAAFRELNGQSPWAGINDSKELAPDLREKMISQAMIAPNDPPRGKPKKR